MKADYSFNEKINEINLFIQEWYSRFEVGQSGRQF